jgi:YVTN family beta-propeller protein
MRSTHKFWFVLLLFILVVVSQSAVAQVVIATVPIGSNSFGLPVGIAVNPNTNKIYVTNTSCSSPPCASPGTVTVIDGATNAVTATVNVGVSPVGIAVNPATNKIYVSNYCGNDLMCQNQSAGTVTVIDANNSNNTTTIHTEFNPYGVAVNPVTNKIYVSNYCGNEDEFFDCLNAGTVTVIDGATNQTTTVNVEYYPSGVAVNPNTNKIYVVNTCGSDVNCLSVATVSVIDGASNTVIATPDVGFLPLNQVFAAEAVNSVSNQVYVPNCGSDGNCLSPGAVTVIDGANNTTNIAMPAVPYDVAVNATTNRIYVSNNDRGTGSVAVIDGSANQIIQVVNVGYNARGVAVDSVTNEIYAVNSCGSDPICVSAGTVTVINGLTYSKGLVAVGDGPESVAVNETTDRIYVPNNRDNTASIIAGDTGLQFVPVTPCRIVDTRLANGTFGGPPIQGGTYRSFPIPQSTCNIPGIAAAAAYSLNVTLVPIQNGPVGYLTIWPAGESQPLVSTMNSDGRIKANAAVVPAGVIGGVSVFVANTTNVLIDIDGYFVPTSGSTLAFYPLTPCRVLDTRNSDGPLGGPYLQGKQERDFPVLSSNCNIPTSAQGYSMNFTVVPVQGQALGYLTVWPAGESQPLVSTLNNPTATIVANAAIVPAGAGGEIAAYPNQNTQLIGDINGYFAPAGQGGLSLYPAVPCRVLDTRQGNGAFTGELTVNVVNSVCAPPTTAQAYVFNATVVPVGRLGYLTLWPDGESQPAVSTLNAIDGAVTSNMAVVPTNNGQVDAYAAGLTQLILDISSYFAP